MIMITKVPMLAASQTTSMVVVKNRINKFRSNWNCMDWNFQSKSSLTITAENLKGRTKNLGISYEECCLYLHECGE